MPIPEIESPVQNISTHPSLETRAARVAIVGAGLVGSTTAYALLMSGMAAEIVLIDRDSRAAAAKIDKYGNRAAEIIDRIRSFYRKSPPQRELVDVNGIIHEMLTLLKGEATRSSIAMRTDLSVELPRIMVDRVQLQQVFMNLMLNGIEAMEDSGGD